MIAFEVGDIRPIEKGGNLLKSLYPELSPPLLIPNPLNSHESHTLRQLQLFEACTIQESFPKDEDNPKVKLAFDHIFFAGGPIWISTFCPNTQQHLNDYNIQSHTDILALAVHPKGNELNPVGSCLCGPGALQIWGIPATTTSEICPSGKPQLLYAIHHNGRLAWDLAWYPINENGASNTPQGNLEGLSRVPIYGLLAAVLANGSICIFPIPHVSHIKRIKEDQQIVESSLATTSLSSSLPGEGELPPFVNISPAAIASGEQLFGNIPSCCSWQPKGRDAPGLGRIVVGCWNGSVLVLNVPELSGSQSLSVLLHVSVDSLAVRRVRWVSTSLTASDDLPHSLFIVASATGHVSVWDARDITAPIVSRLLHRCSVMDVAWMDDPVGVLAALEDSTLRLIMMDAGALGNQKDTRVCMVPGFDEGTVWSISTCPPLSIAAFAGDAGIVGVFRMDRHLINRRTRRPHFPIGGMALEQGALRVLAHDQDLQWAITKMCSKGDKAKIPPATTPFYDDRLAIHTVSFSPNIVDGSVWLAYGGASGIVRCQRLSSFTM